MSTSLPAAAGHPEQSDFIPAHGFALQQPADRRPARPSRLAGLLARVNGGALDRELIAGADPASSARLEARSERLTAPASRALIADGLERLREAGDSPQRRWTAVGRGDAIRANSRRLDDLAELLRGDVPLGARGVAVLSELLSDGTGVAYQGRHQELAERLNEAHAALLN
jgi:hypothetical protein